MGMLAIMEMNLDFAIVKIDESNAHNTLSRAVAVERLMAEPTMLLHRRFTLATLAPVSPVVVGDGEAMFRSEDFFIFLKKKITYLGAHLRPKLPLEGRAGSIPQWTYHAEGAGRRQVEC